jgi:hypothetical protein
MSRIFRFGETLEGHAVPVLNERAVRAGAGILFFFAMASFMNAWLTGNFQPTRVFVVAFLIDFAIRIFVNPRYAPSLVIGQWVVRAQQPEWVGAPQKRFAWAIGFVLAVTMFFLLVVNNVVGPINMLVCASCLVLMFFETAFGICIGCKVYNVLHREQAQLCPGGVCELPPDPRVRTGLAQWTVVAGFAAAMVAAAPHVAGSRTESTSTSPSGEAATAAALDPAEAERCKVPDFAKAIGHEAKWKLHNNCPP